MEWAAREHGGAGVFRNAGICHFSAKSSDWVAKTNRYGRGCRWREEISCHESHIASHIFSPPLTIHHRYVHALFGVPLAAVRVGKRHTGKLVLVSRCTSVTFTATGWTHIVGMRICGWFVDCLLFYGKKWVKIFKLTAYNSELLWH